MKFLRARKEPILLQDGPVPCCVCSEMAQHSVSWCGHGSSDFAHVVYCSLREEHLVCSPHLDALTDKVHRLGYGKRLWIGGSNRRVDFEADGYKKWPCESGCNFNVAAGMGKLPMALP